MRLKLDQILYTAAIGTFLWIAPAAAAAAQDAAAPAEVAQVSAYRINSGDTLEIYVWGEERLQRTVNVLPDGTVAFPLVGQLRAQGLLPQELEAQIRRGLQSQYRGEVPQVTVSVAPTGMQFSVMGRVRSPGSFAPGRYVNVLEALSLAGGPNEFADLDNVVVIRKAGDGVRTLRVRMAPLFRSGASAADVQRANLVRIESGDTVIIP
ncbi:sugar transporter [Erythrobacteraceae bacterium CFH 75059]|uniref:polysaccharide biosynthesis/export family protein n=1 Tax=Qipengyuania thermophila TaxID=2509361 RepID=UPI0010223D3D|nr:polysaccharide biosynthesis/export family protein [Qipengyuania thermophila]TCD04855.1 sugar transporter [Erythrobacteraceae bacterium CFH 75059]